MFARKPAPWGLLPLCFAVAVGCSRQDSQPAAGQVHLQLSPDPPRVGSARVSLSLSDPSGQPLAGAQVRLEGNMNHAGMKPVFAAPQETEPGVYRGAIEFTMAGDWFILVHAVLPDGRRIAQQIDVPGIRAP